MPGGNYNGFKPSGGYQGWADMFRLLPAHTPEADATTNDLLRELIGEVRGMRMEMVRQRWLPDELAVRIRDVLNES